MVSCGETETEYNMFTVSWTGTICRSTNVLYQLLNRDTPRNHPRTKSFVLNLTTEQLAFATDWCGLDQEKITTNSQK